MKVDVLTKDQRNLVNIAKLYKCGVTYDGETDFAIIEVFAQEHRAEEVVDQICDELSLACVDWYGVDYNSSGAEILTNIEYNSYMHLDGVKHEL